MTEQPAFICSHIFKNSHPVLLVIKEQADIQFLCGMEHENAEIPQVVGVAHLLERDKTLNQLMSIEFDFEAERKTVNEDWIITRI
ncbi:MAG: hypothetical protein U0T75_07160 [Chitinophagales bacterium]